MLVTRKYLTILETCRSRKKATTGTTTVGTKVKILNSVIWDLNLNVNDHRNNHSTTTEQPPNNQQPQPLKRGCVVFSCLSKINDPSIQDSDKEWLCSRYDEKTVSDAIDCIIQKDFKPQSTVLKSLKAACKGKWKTSKPDINDFSRNKILSEHLENKGHKYYNFVANHTSLEIVKGGNSPSEIVNYNQKHEYFRKEVETKAKVSLNVNECA